MGSPHSVEVAEHACPMPHRSPPTLTEGEVGAILAVTIGNPRDHLIYSVALGTGLRLAGDQLLDVARFNPRGRLLKAGSRK